MIWLPEDCGAEQLPFALKLYSPPEERVRLVFQPLRPSHSPEQDPRWEDWHSYLLPLKVGFRDYQVMLQEYFLVMYPTKDAISGTPETVFDPCSPNWLGRADWEKLMELLKRDLGRVTRKRRRFYDTFLRWLEGALQHTDIIVVEGNL
ncbi:MAG: BdrN protein [Angelakisella sp.]|jgi:hypothetical protein|nr:BdrN protein [Angelakisella sp.]